MLQSTPMLSRQDNADARPCQPDSAPLVWTRTEQVETQPIIAAIVHAYNEAHPAADVTADAIVRPGRTPHVTWARHLCAYLLVEDYHLTNLAAAHALGRSDHTTVVNSRARVTAALGHDRALQRVLVGARDILRGRAPHAHPRRDDDRRHAFATATSRELAEYRYWRLRSLHASALGGVR